MEGRGHYLKVPPSVDLFKRLMPFQLAKAAPDVASKQSHQFTGNSQVTIICRQRPGPDLTIADF